MLQARNIQSVARLENASCLQSTLTSFVYLFGTVQQTKFWLVPASIWLQNLIRAVQLPPITLGFLPCSTQHPYSPVCFLRRTATTQPAPSRSVFQADREQGARVFSASHNPPRPLTLLGNCKTMLAEMY